MTLRHQTVSPVRLFCRAEICLVGEYVHAITLDQPGIVAPGDFSRV